MSRSLTRELNTKNAFSRIQRFYNEGDITLSGEEEKILMRWLHAHKMVMQRKYKESEIIEKISELFQVSKFTAHNDIYHAQDLFSSAIRVNKKFLLASHAESILLFAEKCKLDKSLSHLVPKLFQEYTRAVVSIPDDLNKETLPPPVMNFFVIEGQHLGIKATVDEVLTRIKNRKHSQEYIEPITDDQP